MSLDEINKSQYSIVTIGVILICALLFATLRMYFWVKSVATPLLNKVAAGTAVSVSEMQTLFIDMQKTIIITYFVLTGFILAIVIAGFIFLRDKANSDDDIVEEREMDIIEKQFYKSHALKEAAVTSDADTDTNTDTDNEIDIILNRFRKSQTVDSDLIVPPVKSKFKAPKRKMVVLVSLVAFIAVIFTLYNLFAPGYYKTKALKMQEAGNYSEAVSLYDKAIKIDSKSPELYYGKGLSLSKSGNYKEAIQFYTKAIDINPKYYEAYYNKGIALTQLKESDNALYTLDMAIKVEPMKTQAYEAKGKLLEELQRYDKALECYKTIYDLDPNNKDIKAKIDNLSSGKTSAPTEQVVMYEPQTGTVLDSTVFRIIANGKQQIALTGKIKALNYAVSHFTGDAEIKSVDNAYTENLFITSNDSSSITIKPDAYQLTVKDRLVISGRAQVFENKFEASLMDNAGNAILRFGVNIQPDKEDGEGPFAIDIPVEKVKSNVKSGYLALIQEVIEDGSKVGIIKIPVKFE